MKPSDISLFSAKEQTLLVSTESPRLEALDEDDLADLLGRVRRARNKYADLHRRQGREAVRTSARRSVTATANAGTARKAELFEDAVSRVARHLSRAARANADELKRERLEAAGRPAGTPSSGRKPTSAARSSSPGGTPSRGKKSTEIVPPARKGATSAANKRAQAAKDRT